MTAREGEASSSPAEAGRVLIVDPEMSSRRTLQGLLRARGYRTATAPGPFKARRVLDELEPHVVFAAERMPGVGGVRFMELVRSQRPELVFVLSGEGRTVGRALEAVRRGAIDYLEKPVDPQALCAAIDRAMREALLLRMRREARASPPAGAFTDIIGDHPALSDVLRTAERVAGSQATVLLSGETGTGKGLLAEAIHRRSRRAEGPFVKLSCAALAPSVLESELFGHERGAFTGATGRREGRLEQAHGGTLYLDEVAEIPPAAQVKLLRFLQDRELERVGGNQTLRVDTRLIAATNRDLRAAVSCGAFREDLFYRLNVVALELPPLRSRRSDIPALAAVFLERFAHREGKRVEAIAPDALERLAAHQWPGNVRELENAIEHAVVMTPERSVRLEHLPSQLRPRRAELIEPVIPGSSLERIKRFAILSTLESVDGNRARAADILGVSPRTLRNRLRAYRE